MSFEVRSRLENIPDNKVLENKEMNTDNVFFNYKNLIKVDGIRNEHINRILENMNMNTNTNIGNNINFDEFKSLGLKILENKNEIKNEIIKNKPLGDLGEITLNQLVDNGFKYLSPLTKMVKDNSVEITSGLTLISMFMIYKKVVKTYEESIFKEESYKHLSAEEVMNLNLVKAKQIRSFMNLAAPLITGLFYVYKKQTGITNFTVKTDINMDNNVDNNVTPSSIFLFIKNKFLIGLVQYF